MNSAQIHYILSNDELTRYQFKGVYARDHFNEKTSKPGLYVINTDDSDKPGEHWVAIYNNGREEFFDSYGNHPSYFGINTTKNVIYNKTRYQNDLSTCCGQYCIYFLTLRCRHHDMGQIKSYLEPSMKMWNDNMVTRYVNKHFNIKTDVSDYPFVIQFCLNKISQK